MDGQPFLRGAAIFAIIGAGGLLSIMTFVKTPSVFYKTRDPPITSRVAISMIPVMVAIAITMAVGIIPL